ncbi:MAG: UDP-3-O-(3-hydroxymyristoyl)glucosamine N-acyltransferase [Saprospiraceae bacterium]|nr:UDP-3-O-(3-hydroxymyristoyl)glucosamine N-acyltransferase [Saprospiraceae bacterium]
MQATASQIASLLNGRVEGNPEVVVTKPARIEEGTEGTISFLGNEKYEQYAYTTKSSILLVSHDFVPANPISSTLIRVSDVYASVAVLLDTFGKENEKEGVISKNAFIHETAEIGENCNIEHFTVVEEHVKIGKNTFIHSNVTIQANVKIGKNCIIHPGVRIYKDCEIGDDCIIHSNVIIGADGFGFAPNENGTFKKVKQLGNVLIEDNVEIGANTTIDRATMGSTIIRSGVKLDNLIMIAHNVEIGKNTVIAAQTGIAGSTKIGENCMIGGQVGIVGHIQIANNTKIQAQSGVSSSVKVEGTALYGSPALPYGDFLKSYVLFKKLPDIQQKIKQLEEALKEKD